MQSFPTKPGISATARIGEESRFFHFRAKLGLTERYPPPWTPDAHIFETCAEYFFWETAVHNDTRAKLANIYIQAHSNKLI